MSNSATLSTIQKIKTYPIEDVLISIAPGEDVNPFLRLASGLPDPRNTDTWSERATCPYLQRVKYSIQDGLTAFVCRVTGDLLREFMELNVIDLVATFEANNHSFEEASQSITPLVVRNEADEWQNPIIVAVIEDTDTDEDF